MSSTKERIHKRYHNQMITCTINVCRLKRELERLCTMKNKNVKMSIDHNAYVET